MAKFKPAGAKKSKNTTATQNVRKALPCLVLIILGVALLSLMFYLSLQSGS